MKKTIAFLLILLTQINISYAQDDKEYNKIIKNEPEKKVEFAFEEDEIPVFVRNEFNEQIQVQLDTGRKYPLGPNEKITLGKRKPGKYTLTVYNKNGDFVDNINKNLTKDSKWILNENTVANSGKITGLSTGQKVAIAAGSVGAAAIGAALINKALEKQEGASPQYPAEAYIPPTLPPTIPQNEIAAQIPAVGSTVTEETVKNNAFAEGGSGFKFLNTKYDQVTLIIEGTDSLPIGSNWVIPKAALTESARPLMYNGEKITINPNQKVTVVIPEGYQLQRYVFELINDPNDGNYVWVLK